MDDFDAVAAFRQGERGAVEDYGWCVRLVLDGEFISRGVIGFSTKAEAQHWLNSITEMIKSGKLYQGYKIKESGVYFAGKGRKR